MKKPLMPLGAVALLFLSCNVHWSDLTLPEEVKIETTPGLYLPLTNNLFGGEEFEKYSPEKLIKDNLSLAKIKERIGANMSGITVSTYEAPGSEIPGGHPPTYLLRYPLAEMPVDLSKYMEGLKIEGDGGEPITFDIPDLPPWPGLSPDYLPPIATLIPDESQRTKSTTVDIRDMADLLTSLTYTTLGIKIKEKLEGVLEIKLRDGNTSGDGLDLVLKGTYNEAENCTYFVDSIETGKTWKPSGKQLAITMTLIDYPPNYSGAGATLTITPEFVLEWTEATINPGENGTLKGEMPLDFSELGGTLEGISFPAGSIKAYLYTSELPESDAKITLTSISTTASVILVDDKSLHDVPVAPELPADGAPYDQAIPPSSLADSDNPDGAIDLTGTLNSSMREEVTLKYEVAMGAITLKKSDLEESKTISAVLLIKLPLALEYHGSSFDATGDYRKNGLGDPVTKSDYLTFEIKDFNFSDIIGDDDLLEPIREEFKSGGVSGRLELTNISLVLANCDVSLFPSVCIAIKQNKEAKDGILIDFSDDSPNSAGKDIPITFDLDPNEPFTPSIEILLKKDQNKDFTTLSINEDGKFSFGLIVEIESALDATIALQGVK